MSGQAVPLAEVAARPPMGRVALAVGVFDGVHRGHRALLSALREAAAARDARPVGLVFDPPPIEVIRPGTTVLRLSSPAETMARIDEAGVTAMAIRFDPALRELSPETFLAGLAPALAPVAVVMTAGSAFGRDRAGTPERVAQIGADRGFEVVLVDPEDDGGVISSSRIRDALAAGDVQAATRLLGRPPSWTGTVVRGEGRGQALGYPTANLAFDYRPALPALGIYAGYALEQPALVSVGRRPTFHQDGELVVEAHLLDWSGDLYGQVLRVEAVVRLRPERRFEGAVALVSQMRRDEAAARRALKTTRAVLAGRRATFGRGV